MLVALSIGLCTGLVTGGAIVFATISWIANHVSTVETNGDKYGLVQTSKIQVAVKLSK